MAWASAACGGASDGAAGAPDAGATLAPWHGPLRDLFDDAIDPAAVGLSLDGRSPAHHPLLRARAQHADVAARVRVQTVTVDTLGARTRYKLALQVGYPTLLPARLPDRVFELTIEPTSAAFGIVRTLDTTLRGRTFVGFLRRFPGDEGPELHWHLTADTAEVAWAVQLAGLGGVTRP
jgi:hypothetical protein